MGLPILYYYLLKKKNKKKKINLVLLEILLQNGPFILSINFK